MARLRANATLKAATVGGFHEGFAPAKVKYPFLVYQFHSSPYAYLWGSVMTLAGFDVFAFSENSVDANNIDGLVANQLHDAPLAVNGQTTLICRRVADIPMPPDLDSEGKRIFQVGGSYEIWTDQPLT